MSDLARPEDARAARQAGRGLFAVPSLPARTTEADGAPPDDRTPVADDRRAPLLVEHVSIDGFGALAGVELSLGPGITVVLGPNEAGKSTLFDFLTAVLFGFPQRKADARFRAPVRGGRHGGRVRISRAAGGSVIVERYGPPGKRTVVTRPDGSPGDERDLADLLGGANADLFRAVFAVDLDDLNRLDGMSSEEVREVLFSSSILGQRRSAARAMKELESLREGLVRPRQGGEANALAAELARVRNKLGDARANAETYASHRREVSRLEAELDLLAAKREGARSRANELGVLLHCWDVITERRALEAELTGVAELSAGERDLLDTADRVAALEAELSGHAERLGLEGRLLGQRAGLEASVKAKVTELGGEWARSLAGSEDFDPDALRPELESRLERLATAKAELASASALAARAEREALAAEPPPGARAREGSAGAGTTPDPAGPDETLTQLRVRLAHLRELRGVTMTVDQLAVQVARGRESEAARRSAAGAAEGGPAVVRRLALVLAGAALVVACLAAALAVSGQPFVGGALGVVAAGLASGAAWARSSAARQAGADPADDGSGTGPANTVVELPVGELARATRQAAEVAERLGLDIGAGPLSQATVQRLIDETELEIDRCRGVKEAHDRHRDLARHAADAEAAKAAAATLVEAAAGEVAELLRRMGTPEELGREPMQTLDRLAQLRERLAALARLAPDIAAGAEKIEHFEGKVGALAPLFGLTPPPASAPAGRERTPVSAEVLSDLVSSMSSAIRTVVEREDRRRSILEKIGANDRETSRVLGNGEQADLLRAELETGRVLEWQREQQQVRDDSGRLDEDYERAVREHEKLALQMAQLASSADVPLLEQRCAELEEAIGERLSRFLVASGSRLLLHRTLRRYEEQRQPAVLERAADHFRRVTDGRYVKLAVDAGDGSKPTIRVIGRDGQSLDASELSRGTTEQLYLCIRLGLAESFGRERVALPIVLDDVLVNFEPARQEAMAAALAETAVRHQVIFLTCHPHVAALLAEVGGSTTETVELGRV